MATLKQKRLKENLLTGKYSTRKAAMLAAGYTQSSAEQSTRIIYAASMQEFLGKGGEVGITDEYLLGRIAEAIHQPNLSEAMEHIKWWVGLRKPDKIADTINNTQVNVVSSPESIEESVLLWIKNNPDKHHKVKALLN